MAHFKDNSEKNKDGYNIIHKSIANSKTVEQLTQAVSNSLQIIKECNLDDYQVSALEQYGMRKYEQIIRNLSSIEQFRQRNKFQK